MTARANISMDLAMINALMETIDEDMIRNSPHGAQLVNVVHALGEQVDELEKIERATTLHEDDEMIVLEDPDEGDEAPVWVFDKQGINGLDKGGPFYDAEDPDEIYEWLKGMREACLN